MAHARDITLKNITDMDIPTTITLTDRQYKRLLDVLVAQQDQVMTAEEAAAFLRVSTKWLYEHADKIGYRVLAGRKTFLRSELLAYRDTCIEGSTRGGWQRGSATV